MESFKANKRFIQNKKITDGGGNSEKEIKKELAIKIHWMKFVSYDESFFLDRTLTSYMNIN